MPLKCRAIYWKVNLENIDSLIVILLLIFGIVGLSIFLVLRNQQMEANKAQKRRIVFDARAKQGVWAGATIVTAQHHTSAEEMREFGYGIKRTKNLGKGVVQFFA